MRKFEECWLCLRPAVTPVCTSTGYLFCRECILNNLADQKKQQKKQVALWNAQQQLIKHASNSMEAEKKNEAVRRFLAHEDSLPSATLKDSKKEIIPTARKPNDDQSKFLEVDKAAARAQAFWCPENAPMAAPTAAAKPKQHLVCPMDGTTLKLKDLIPLHPELAEDGKEEEEKEEEEEEQKEDKEDKQEADEEKEQKMAQPGYKPTEKQQKLERKKQMKNNYEGARWVCCISKRILNHQKVVALKPTGSLMLLEYAKKYALGKTGFAGDREITNEDLIHMIPGGTGFSSHNRVIASKYRPGQIC
eukprot:GHVT01033926.1.p1 GENE.GHVT01033926.1~~GHVT01033926.1.p1  ORF type:complete len:305 (-),score=92.20 GHVT01033926.1:275-1189(-)